MTDERQVGVGADTKLPSQTPADADRQHYLRSIDPPDRTYARPTVVDDDRGWDLITRLPGREVALEPTAGPIYGVLAAYTHGLFAGEMPTPYAGFEAISLGNFFYTVTASGFSTRDFRSITCNVDLSDSAGTPTGESVIAYVAGPAWPATTDILTLEALPSAITVPEADAPAGTHAAYEITHKVTAVAPQPSADWVALQTNNEGPSVVSAGTAREALILETGWSSPYYVNGIEPGWYRVGARVMVIGNTNLNLFHVELTDQASSGPYTNTVSCHRLTAYIQNSHTAQRSSATMYGIFAVIPDGIRRWGLDIGATATSKTVHMNDFHFERTNPGVEFLDLGAT